MEQGDVVTIANPIDAGVAFILNALDQSSRFSSDRLSKCCFMLIYLTQELSIDISDKFGLLSFIHPLIHQFFKNRNYGPGLSILYIGLVCKAGKLVHAVRQETSRPAEVHDVQYIYIANSGDRHSKSLSYGQLLNYNEYRRVDDISVLLARDILYAIDTIQHVRKIRNFDLAAFKRDFELFFRQVGWM